MYKVYYTTKDGVTKWEHYGPPGMGPGAIPFAFEALAKENGTPVKVITVIKDKDYV